VDSHRDFLLDFSSTIGGINPEDLTRAHIAQYAAALDERGEDKVMKDVYLDDAREFLHWLGRGRRQRNAVEAIGWFIGHSVTSVQRRLERILRREDGGV